MESYEFRIGELEIQKEELLAEINVKCTNSNLNDHFYNPCFDFNRS